MSFDDLAQNLAEAIDAILTTERCRERRIDLIKHCVRRAIGHGYKAAKKDEVR